MAASSTSHRIAVLDRQGVRCLRKQASKSELAATTPCDVCDCDCGGGGGSGYFYPAALDALNSRAQQQQQQQQVLQHMALNEAKPNTHTQW